MGMFNDNKTKSFFRRGKQRLVDGCCEEPEPCCNVLLCNYNWQIVTYELDGSFARILPALDDQTFNYPHLDPENVTLGFSPTTRTSYEIDVIAIPVVGGGNIAFNSITFGTNLFEVTNNTPIVIADGSSDVLGSASLDTLVAGLRTSAINIKSGCSADVNINYSYTVIPL